MVSSIRTLALISGAFTLALGAPLASLSAAPDRAGAHRGGAKSSVNRPPPHQKGGGGGAANKNYSGGGANKNRSGGGAYAGNKPGGNKPGGGKAGGGHNNVGNTVVVAPGRGGGGGNYNNGYNNGYNNNNYHGNNNWDNDDDDFLEFVGKTAAITAGVSVVAAVIGSSTNQKPSGCQESVSNGQVYMYCNGNWYQPIQSGSNTSYQVVNPPR